MKRYTPSVKNNNELKQEVVNELKALVYRLEKGRHGALDGDSVAEVLSGLKEQTGALENSIGTGEENIGVLAKDALAQLKILKKGADGSVTHRFEEAAEELGYTLGLWKDVLDGSTVLETEEEIRAARVSRSRKKLDLRLAELEQIKASFTENSKRLEKEIAGLEKDLAEYEAAMLKEDNERRINDLYRQIKAVKSKIDMLNIRHGNYSACFNLLDMIYANAREILQATDFASEEIAKAKVLLNIEKLKKVVVEPDKAIAILKRMDADIKEIAGRTASMDGKVFGLDSGGAAVSEDALAYKEELMRKQREKENLKNAALAEENTEKSEGKNNGVL